MEADADISLKKLRVDGGVVKNNLLMQFQSDLLGVVVDRPVINETTALGAAYLAGIAVGYWESQDRIAEKWKLDTTYRPTMSQDVRDELYSGWKTAVKAAMVFK